MTRKGKGWTHPDHWKMAFLGTVLQIASCVFAVVALWFLPAFTDARISKDKPTRFNLADSNVMCEDKYCYHKQVKDGRYPKSIKDAVFLTTGVRSSYMEVERLKKKDPGWLKASRTLIIIGISTSMLSLGLQILVFWPIVLVGKVLNPLLHFIRAVDVLGAPLKFVGVFIVYTYISEVNRSYAWLRHIGILQVEPLPFGLVLFSYILQILCFVCYTLATDKGAKGQPTHVERFTAAQSFGFVPESGDEAAAAAAAMEESLVASDRRSVYHPVDSKRSSRIIAEVGMHYGKAESIV